MRLLWRLASRLTANLIMTHGPVQAGTVYLSFDDGPDPKYTERLIALLAEHNAKASFFLIAGLAAANPELVARILSCGHSIGNHSMSHPAMFRLGFTAQWQQIDQGDAVLQGLDPGHKHAFRPPNGRITWAALLNTLWRRRPMMLWSIDSMDYKLGAEAVVKRLRSRPPTVGDIILFHDDGECALLALQVLLPEWKLAGLRFLPLECAS